MNSYSRIVGIAIAACGLALCYGAIQLWPDEMFAVSPGIDVLRIVGAAIVAVLGVGNVAAGFVAAFTRPVRE